MLVAFLLGISNKQLRSGRQSKWYLSYLGFFICIELITEILILGFDNQNTSFIYPFYIAGEFFILSNLLFRPLQSSKKWHFIIGIISLILFSEAAILWFNNEFFTPSIGKVFSHLTIISIAAYLLIKKLKELESYDLFLIIYGALFLYYVVSLFLFLLVNQLTRDNIVIWTMNNLLSSVLYGTSIYTFYRFKKW